MRRAVLLAHPAGHSLSPAMHDAAFAELGIDARYEAWDVPPSDLPEAVQKLRSDAILGANVTVPHKTAIVSLLDEVRGAATAIGAVNVVVRDGERLVGDSSDGEGFLRSLQEADVDAAERHAVLIGAGGAARAVGWALLQAGVDRLTIMNRTPERAADLVELLNQAWLGANVAVARTVSELAPVDLWVNATSVGMQRSGVDPDVSPLPDGAFEHRSGGADPVAVDLVYRPRTTRLLRDARAAGLRTVDGAGMLLHQGAVAFEAWTGRSAPVAVMRRALDEGLAADGAS